TPLPPEGDHDHSLSLSHSLSLPLSHSSTSLPLSLSLSLCLFLRLPCLASCFFSPFCPFALRPSPVVYFSSLSSPPLFSSSPLPLPPHLPPLLSSPPLSLPCVCVC